MLVPSNYIAPHLFLGEIPGEPLTVIYPATGRGPAVPTAQQVRARLAALAAPDRLQVCRAVARLCLVDQLSAAASYACTAPAGASITACTGPVASGSPVDTAAPGQHSFTINASDSDGLAATQTVTYTVAPGPGTGMGTTGSTPPKPSITALRQTHPIWRTGGKLAEISRRHPTLGTTFSFTLNEQASVVLRFTRLLPGLKLHGKCVNRTARNSRKPHCTQTRVAGRLSLAVHVGANHLRFQGRLAPTKRLTPATYTLTITATDGAGQTTTSHRLTFTIVK